MKKLPADSKKCVNRRTIAAVLTVIYVLILFAPLVSFAVQSSVFAHAVHGECSGNCDADGCSLESRTNHSCCCAQKKQHPADIAPKLPTDNCGATKSAVAPVTKGDCCNSLKRVKPVVARNDCCSKGSDKKTEGAVQKEKNTNREFVYKCGNRCGTGKQFVLAGAGTSELLPYIYSQSIAPSHEGTRYISSPHNMISRHSEPPYPPPKIPVSA
ncbi:MAG: hypothetical protein ACOYL3_14820 [Desulfuromonadaceae bacterium]